MPLYEDLPEFIAILPLQDRILLPHVTIEVTLNSIEDLNLFDDALINGRFVGVLPSFRQYDKNPLYTEDQKIDDEN